MQINKSMREAPVHPAVLLFTGLDDEAGIINASYEGGGFVRGGSDLSGGHPRAAALPSLRFGRGADGTYRDTPAHRGTVRGGSVGVGPGRDSGAHYRSRGGRGLTNAGRQRISSWMDFFMRSDAEGGMGLDRDRAMGMVGMMQGESGQNLDPDQEGRDVNGPSGGTAQWHDVDGKPGGRLTQLKAFAARMKRSWTDVGVQQAFWKHEALTTENKAWRAILAAPDGRGALAAGVQHYERPRSPGAEIAKRMPNYDRLEHGDFDKDPAYPDEGRRGFATSQREAEQAVQPRRAAPAVPNGTRTEAMNGAIDFDHSGLDAAISKVDTLHAKLRSLKATASVDINHRHRHEGDRMAGNAPRFSPYRSHEPAQAGRVLV